SEPQAVQCYKKSLTFAGTESLGSSVKGLPKGQWSLLRFLLKPLVKRLRMLKSQFVGDLTDRKVGGTQLFLGAVDQAVLYMLLGSLPGVKPQQSTQIVR